MGTGQRRPSRSPRSQRSRSADVDCLKKYTERRVEERRHTEVTDTSKLDPSRWIPLPKNIGRVQPPGKKSPQPTRDEEKRRSVIETEETIIEPGKSTTNTPKRASPTKEEDAKTEEKNEARSPASPRQATGRSHSTDVTHVKNEKIVEERRHTECSDPRTIATRWIPQINTSRFRCDVSPLARISNSCEITKNAATRWMTFAKNPSPCPIPRMNPERKSPATEVPRKDEGQQTKDVKKETPKWEPLRKFSPVSTKINKETEQKEDDSESNRDPALTKQSPDSAEQASSLSQRMRELYDFKTENEWPKRATNPRRENTWISKSSSEDEKNNHSARRNSQDLEFNDRTDRNKLKDAKTRTEENRKKFQKSTLDHNDVFDEEYEERVKRFNERLRFSEDLGLAKPRVKERRTYSDDYEEKERRASKLVRNENVKDIRASRENKRNSDASVKSKDSRGSSYADVEPVKRNSRTSDTSYASIGNYPAKRGSVECPSTKIALPPRRAFSQTEERPSTPVPPVEWNDDRYAAMKTMSERQKRDSTRYKVYLT